MWLGALVIFLCAAGPASTAAPAATASADEAESDADDGRVAIAGRIVTVDGQPVAGATAAASWGGNNPLPVAYDALVSDENGEFSGSIHAWSFPAGVAAYNDDGSLAGIVSVEEDGLQAIEIVLRPSVRVTAQVTRTEAEGDIEGAYIALKLNKHSLAGIGLDGGNFEMLLPQGELSWVIYDSWYSMVSGDVTLGAERTDIDLGTLDIPAAFLAKHVGKELPEWTVSASRGVPLDKSSLAAHRGKWLLIEFWGFW